jgi:transposase
MPRRTFTREFKEAAVKLVHEQGYSPGEAAKSLGVDLTTLKYWLKKFPAPTGTATPEGSLRTEVRRLREENKRLLMEREILKKATAFFAKQQP